MNDHIPDLTKMIGETPRTDTVNAYIRTRRDFKITDHQMWQEHGKQLELKLNEMERLAAVRLNYINQLEREFTAANERINRLEEALKDLLIAVTFADPPKEFNGVLCNEALVPIGFVDSARAALESKEAKP